MKFLKTFLPLVYLILFTSFSQANPVILFHINEIQIDSSGWKIELKNLDMGFFPSLDSCYLTTLNDTTYFKPGISTTDSFVIVTPDSMLDNLAINRLGDIVGFHYIDGSPLDQIGFGNITSGGVIAAPLFHQSICLREWREEFQRYYYYLDNTPSLGQANDSINAKGHIAGIITDSTGNPLSDVEVVYDYYDAPDPFYYDISVFTDSLGCFILKDYARLNRLEIRKQNYQTEYRRLQVWPEDTAAINLTLHSVIDKIQNEENNFLDNYNLSQNYPNPFNNSTTFTYTLPKSNYVEIGIYDLSGKLVDKLFSGNQNLGEYKVHWNAETVASGVYVYQLKTKDLITHKKCLLIK